MPTNLPTYAAMLGVAILCVRAEEAGIDIPALPNQFSRQIHSKSDPPEVLLSVKYDKGIIDGIYLAQFRKSEMVVPSVPEGSQLCQDLCHAGLGGQACGSTCQNLTPVGLIELTTSHSSEAAKHTNASEEQIGHPRLSVCGILCNNNLGYPLCGCKNVDGLEYLPDWQAICDSFCLADKYTLRGCPTCDQTKLQDSSLETTMRILDTYDGWMAWCDVQCRLGEGGAACNCDRAPFS